MRHIHTLHLYLLGWPRYGKRILMLLVDSLVLPGLFVLSYSIRLDQPLSIPGDWWLVVAAPIVTIIMLLGANYYRAIVRYLGTELIWSVMFGMTAACAILAALAYMVPAQQTPRSIFIIYWLLGVFYLGGSRFVARRYLQWVIGGYGDRAPVAVYGAGEAGVQAVAALQSGHEFWPVALVDDNPALQGMVIQGVTVLNRDGLQKLVEKKRVTAVLLSMPSISRSRRLDVVSFLEQLHVKVQSIPGLPDIIHGRARIEEVRDVAIEDLLGRDSVPPNKRLLHGSVTNKNVMVTGAGGSIGSELCRQVVALQPASLILLDVSEYSLYAIERELGPLCEEAGIVLRTVLGSVLSRSRIAAVLASMRIQTVYHAAAYKHVPIVEENPLAGLQNNVLGTLAMAQSAEEAGVERFILISTDKAVRPTNVMGASKRLSEMVLQALADRRCGTIFTMVRFGNVLGSSGSVVPVFREQINAGGPVTVTHPGVTRYFMTIPEAAQLVMQAGSMASGGEVFVLDMGEPVLIYDLACTMIHLMGLTVRDADLPDGDIAIQFTGLRPGEKLYEELLIGEDSIDTSHPGIMRAREEFISWQEMAVVIEAIRSMVASQDKSNISDLLTRYVTGYGREKYRNADVISVDTGDDEGASLH